jgi:hypothetical protein
MTHIEKVIIEQDFDDSAEFTMASPATATLQSILPAKYHVPYQQAATVQLYTLDGIWISL